MFIMEGKWSPQTDSNHRPADYKSAALPTELCGQYPVATRVKFTAPIGKGVILLYQQSSWQRSY